MGDGDAPIRGRFAPSPTGDLHLGNARTALLAWLQIRSLGGQFVLRAEDLDPTRSRPEYLDRQIDELRWLGIDWDEGPDIGGGYGPYLQSRRQDAFDAALSRLAAEGLTFDCFCSRKEILAAASAPQAGDDEGPAYPGTCLNRPRAAGDAAHAVAAPAPPHGGAGGMREAGRRHIVTPARFASRPSGSGPVGRRLVVELR